MTDKSGPVFPILDIEEAMKGYWGLTKREYLAGQIMAGLGSWTPYEDPQQGAYEKIAERINRRADFAVRAADALLARLNDD